MRIKLLADSLFRKMKRHILRINDDMIAAYNDKYKVFAEEQKKPMEMATKQQESN